MFDQTVTQLALIRSRRGRSDELGAQLSTLLQPAHAAPGCLHCAVLRDAGDADLWLVHAVWSSRDALMSYLGSPQAQVFSAIIDNCSARELELRTLEGTFAAQEAARRCAA